jgi:hypothetical protein
VEPSAVHYAVVEGSVDEPVLVDSGRYSAPKDFDEAEALTWYRKRTKELLEQFGPGRGAIKYMESIAGAGRAPRSTDSTRRRHRIEGVVLQLLDEVVLTTVTARFTTIGARLGTRTAKDFLEGNDLRGLDWSGKPALVREAILAATGALSADG